MTKIVIDRRKCRRSGECVSVCPSKAIAIKDGVVTIDHAKCDLDGICIPACPNAAISFSE